LPNDVIAIAESEQATRQPADISFNGVTVRFGALTAMGPLDLKVRAGEFVAIIGPSGCGKSTLLNLVSGTLKASEGEVYYHGEKVEGPNRNVGYITQKNYCLPWLTVNENIMLPLEFRNFPKLGRAKRVEQVIAQVGLQGFENAYPRQLSGGMLQRVMIARTLVYEPQTYLMDEPFGSLDALLRTRMHADLLRLRQETGATFIFVTHDLVEAVTLAERVVVMSRRPGQIKLVIDIEHDPGRTAIGVQSDPRYGKIIAQLWAALDLQ